MKRPMNKKKVSQNINKDGPMRKFNAARVNNMLKIFFANILHDMGTMSRDSPLSWEKRVVFNTRRDHEQQKVGRLFYAPDETAFKIPGQMITNKQEYPLRKEALGQMWIYKKKCV